MLRGRASHAQLDALWRHPDFFRLWAGQAISAFGSQITFLALPLTAVLVLEASPAQMGLLEATQALPALLLGLFAGVWVDRHRRRTLLILADMGRFLTLLVIPAAAAFGLLRMGHLYSVALLMGTLGLFFGVAHRAYLPALVGRERLVDANSKLEIGNSLAEILGPGIAGALVELVTAPIAIAVDALSYLLSALLLALIRAPEPAVTRGGEERRMLGEIRDGLRLVVGQRTLRALILSMGVAYLFNSAQEAVWMLYVTRGLGLEATLIGLIFATGSFGFLLGAFLPARVARRFGLGRGLIAGLFLLGASDLLLPLLGAGLPDLLIIAVLVTSQFLFGLGLTLYRVGQVSVCQGLTPDPLQGRVNATISFLTSALMPLGALLGGALGESAGLRPTLFLAASGEMLAAVGLLFTPVRALRMQPAPQPAPGGESA